MNILRLAHAYTSKDVEYWWKKSLGKRRRDNQLNGACENFIEVRRTNPIEFVRHEDVWPDCRQVPVFQLAPKRKHSTLKLLSYGIMKVSGR